MDRLTLPGTPLPRVRANVDTGARMERAEAWANRALSMTFLRPDDPAWERRYLRAEALFAGLWRKRYGISI